MKSTPNQPDHTDPGTGHKTSSSFWVKLAIFALGLAAVSANAATSLTISNASFEYGEMTQEPTNTWLAVYTGETVPGPVFRLGGAGGNYYCYSYAGAPTNTIPALPANAGYQGNISASTNGPDGNIGRQIQEYRYQSSGGWGPYIVVVPHGWTLKRSDNGTTPTIWVDPSGEFQMTNRVSAGATVNKVNEDSFTQRNTESTNITGRFYTAGANPNDGVNDATDRAQWQAHSNQVVVLRNRSNRTIPSGIDAGRGVLLSQTLSYSASVGDQFTLTWLVGDRISALKLGEYDVVVRAGGSEIYRTNSAGDISLRPANDDGVTKTNGIPGGFSGQFREVSRTFTATASGTVEVSFGVGGSFGGAANSGAALGAGVVAFDNIRLTVNRRPTAAAITTSVAIGGSVNVNVEGKYTSDADADALTVVSTTTPANGTVSIVGGTNLLYTSTSASGETLNYVVSDGSLTATNTVTISTYSPQGFNKLSGPTGTGPYSFSYLGIPGAKYALEETASLTPPITWTSLVTNTASGTGGVSFTVTPANPSGFFRARYVP